MSYTYQNLTGLKNLKTRHITLQHIQNSGLNKLRWIYGLIYKIGLNWKKVAETQFKIKVANFGWSSKNRYFILIFCMTKYLVEWYYSRESGLDPLCCRIFDKSLWNYECLCYEKFMLRSIIQLWIFSMQECLIVNFQACIWTYYGDMIMIILMKACIIAYEWREYINEISSLGGNYWIPPCEGS